MSFSILFLAATLVSQPSAALHVSLKVARDHRRWDGYPASINKPIGSWHHGTLHVHVVENEIGSAQEEGSSASVTGNNLTICYRESSPHVTPGDYQIGGPVVPVILEFSVKGLRQKSYTINVSKKCASPG
jgi:hypothetical protein